MKKFAPSFALSFALAIISTSALAQGGPSTLHAPPAAVQYLPYGVSTPQMTGTRADGSTFDYRFDRKRVAHFWKTYNHRLVPIPRGQEGPYGGSYASTFWNIPTNWTGDLGKCVTGTISNGINEAAVRQLNWYRAMMGTAPVIIGGTADRLRAQQSALVIASGVAIGLPLTHTPDSKFPCLNAETLENAGKTQLTAGSGPAYMRGPYSIDQWMDDFGSSNFQVAHRQITTSPLTGSVAYGEASFAVPNSLGVVGALETRLGIDRTQLADVLWPNAGYVPVQAYPWLSNRWSMACAGCDFSSATVSVLRNGTPTTTRVETVATIFPGLPALVWEMQGIGEGYRASLNSGDGYPIQDDVFDVTISFRKNGQPAIKTYRTTVFNPEVDTDFVPPFDLTDMWWVPTESGWGMKLTQATDGNVFGAVYFYDDVGNPRWMTIQGTWTASGVFSGKLYTTRGPGFQCQSV
jgi:hypothetical protein